MLIGIVGVARSGKDTVTSLILESPILPGTKQRYAFGDPIKDAVNTLFGWDERHRDGELKEVMDPEWGFSPRHAYQTFGTEWGRECLRQDLWFRMAEKKLSDADHTIISDVRFLNEAYWIREKGGILIKVIRKDVEAIKLHKSEMEISEISSDYVFNNNSTVENLKTLTDLTLDRIVKENHGN